MKQYNIEATFTKTTSRGDNNNNNNNNGESTLSVEEEDICIDKYFNELVEALETTTTNNNKNMTDDSSEPSTTDAPADAGGSADSRVKKYQYINRPLDYRLQRMLRQLTQTEYAKQQPLHCAAWY